MHAQLKHYLEKGEPLWTASELEREVDGVDNRVRTRLKVERDTHRYYCLKKLQSLGSQPLKGEVVRRLGKRFLVALSDFGIREACELRGGTNVGDDVTVVAHDIHPARDHLVLKHA